VAELTLIHGVRHTSDGCTTAEGNAVSSRRDVEKILPKTNKGGTYGSGGLSYRDKYRECNILQEICQLRVMQQSRHILSNARQ